MQYLNSRKLRFAVVPFLALALASCADQPAPLAPTGGPLFHGIGADGLPGSHFRLAHVNWVRTATNTAEFTFVFGARTGFYFASPPALGSTHTFGDVRFFFGDGTSIVPTFTITFVDAANGWFEARAVFSKTYSGPGPYTAFWDDCCRLGTTTPWSHRNNPDGSARIETIVNFASQGSARTNLPAIVTCAPNSTCTFSVPAVTTGGETVRYRLATVSEMAGNQPAGASINPTTGLYSWNTTGASLHPTLRNVFSTQVIMETVVGNTVTTKSGVDFLIEITSTANAPPVFQPPTPADGAVFNVAPGDLLSFSVAASDPDGGDVVTLGAIGLPPGATFPIPPAGNPVSTTFNFTPSAGQLGSSFVTSFLATDNRGGSTSRAITINVTAAPPPPPPTCENVDIDFAATNPAMPGTVSLGQTNTYVALSDIQQYLPRPFARANHARIGASWATGVPAISFAVSDYDGDGRRDVVLTYRTSDLAAAGLLPLGTTTLQVWGQENPSRPLYCGSTGVTVVP